MNKEDIKLRIIKKLSLEPDKYEIIISQSEFEGKSYTDIIVVKTNGTIRSAKYKYHGERLVFVTGDSVYMTDIKSMECLLLESL